MWITIIILGYFIGVWLLIRFMQAVSSWDDEIGEMIAFKRWDNEMKEVFRQNQKIIEPTAR